MMRTHQKTGIARAQPTARAWYYAFDHVHIGHTFQLNGRQDPTLLGYPGKFMFVYCEFMLVIASLL